MINLQFKSRLLSRSKLLTSSATTALALLGCLFMNDTVEAQKKSRS